MFLALHDIRDEAMGPTHFCPETHAPRCFPDERWRPPTESLAADKGLTWFEMHAGDAVLMDSLTWHCGGANTSERRRTLCAISFVEPTRTACGQGGEAGARLRLCDFVPQPVREADG